MSLYEVPQKSGGRRTARIVLNIQESIAQLGMHRTTMLDIALSKLATRSIYADWMQSLEGLKVVKKEPDSQEGTKGRGGRRSGGRVLKGEKGGGWSGSGPVIFRGHQGDSASRFGSPQQFPNFPRRILYNAQILSDARSYFHKIFVVRALLRPAAYECTFPALRYVHATMRLGIFVIFAALFILKLLIARYGP